ncbi:MAG: DUF1579 domain-containing protein [Ignavibacteriae bacterium]|nr:DUF1579 domain-containing protein [Ignavibacteriota bacterium]
MKRHRLFFGMAFTTATLLSASLLIAQDKKQAPNVEEMMKKWEEVAAPGENHKKLNDFVGSWETATSMWMEGPQKPPMVSKGTATMRWTLDGRFLYQEASGEMMGKPFSGMGFTGYNNVNKRYEMFWIDNSSTAMFTGDGTFDQSGKVLTLYGKMDDPTTGEHGKNIKYVLRVVDKDKHIFEFHDPVYEPNTKMGEIVYTRKK